jgi:hypothetical protein
MLGAESVPLDWFLLDGRRWWIGLKAPFDFPVEGVSALA